MKAYSLDYLVEDLTIQVGGGVPYSPRTYPYATDIDTTAPVYPLRASFKQCLCGPLSDILDNKGRNCSIFDYPKATGVCFKTTFGDCVRYDDQVAVR